VRKHAPLRSFDPLIVDTLVEVMNFTPVAARLKLSVAGSRPIAQIRQSTVWLRPSSSGGGD
jgi:hypothetical protein